MNCGIRELWRLLLLTLVPICTQALRDEDLRPSLSCLLLGDYGCKCKCAILCKTYGCVDWNPGCDGVYCDCKEQWQPVVIEPDIVKEFEGLVDFDDVLAVKFKRTPVFLDLEDTLYENPDLLEEVMYFLRHTHGHGKPFKDQFRLTFPELDYLLKRLKPRPLKEPRGNSSQNPEVPIEPLGNLDPPTSRWGFLSDWWNKPAAQANINDNKNRIIDMVNGVEKKEDLLSTMNMLKDSGDIPLYTDITKHFLKNGLIMPDGTRILEPISDSNVLKKSLANDGILHAIENKMKEEEEFKKEKKRKQMEQSLLAEKKPKIEPVKVSSPANSNQNIVSQPESKSSFWGIPSWFSSQSTASQQPVVTNALPQVISPKVKQSEYSSFDTESHVPSNTNNQYFSQDEPAESIYDDGYYSETSQENSWPNGEENLMPPENYWGHEISKYPTQSNYNQYEHSDRPADEHYKDNHFNDYNQHSAFNSEYPLDQDNDFTDQDYTNLEYVDLQNPKEPPTMNTAQSNIASAEPDWFNFSWEQENFPMSPTEEDFLNNKIPQTDSGSFTPQLHNNSHLVETPPMNLQLNQPAFVDSSPYFFGDSTHPQEIGMLNRNQEIISLPDDLELGSSTSDESSDGRNLNFFFNKLPVEDSTKQTNIPTSTLTPTLNKHVSETEESDENEANFMLQNLLKSAHVPLNDSMPNEDNDTLSIGSRNLGPAQGFDEFQISNPKIKSFEPLQTPSPIEDDSSDFDDDYIIERTHLNRLHGIIPDSSESIEYTYIPVTRIIRKKKEKPIQDSTTEETLKEATADELPVESQFSFPQTTTSVQFEGLPGSPILQVDGLPFKKANSNISFAGGALPKSSAHPHSQSTIPKPMEKSAENPNSHISEGLINILPSYITDNFSGSVENMYEDEPENLIDNNRAEKQSGIQVPINIMKDGFILPLENIDGASSPFSEYNSNNLIEPQISQDTKYFDKPVNSEISENNDKKIPSIQKDPKRKTTSVFPPLSSSSPGKSDNKPVENGNPEQDIFHNSNYIPDKEMSNQPSSNLKVSPNKKKLAISNPVSQNDKSSNPYQEGYTNSDNIQQLGQPTTRPINVLNEKTDFNDFFKPVKQISLENKPEGDFIDLSSILGLYDHNQLEDLMDNPENKMKSDGIPGNHYEDNEDILEKPNQADIPKRMYPETGNPALTNDNSFFADDPTFNDFFQASINSIENDNHYSENGDNGTPNVILPSNQNNNEISMYPETGNPALTNDDSFFSDDSTFDDFFKASINTNENDNHYSKGGDNGTPNIILPSNQNNNEISKYPETGNPALTNDDSLFSDDSTFDDFFKASINPIENDNHYSEIGDNGTSNIKPPSNQNNNKISMYRETGKPALTNDDSFFSEDSTSDDFFKASINPIENDNHHSKGGDNETPNIILPSNQNNETSKYPETGNPALTNDDSLFSDDSTFDDFFKASINPIENDNHYSEIGDNGTSNIKPPSNQNNNEISMYPETGKPALTNDDSFFAEDSTSDDFFKASINPIENDNHHSKGGDNGTPNIILPSNQNNNEISKYPETGNPALTNDDSLFSNDSTFDDFFKASINPIENDNHYSEIGDNETPNIILPSNQNNNEISMYPETGNPALTNDDSFFADDSTFDDFFKPSINPTENGNHYSKIGDNENPNIILPSNQNNNEISMYPETGNPSLTNDDSFFADDSTFDDFFKPSINPTENDNHYSKKGDAGQFDQNELEDLDNIFSHEKQNGAIPLNKLHDSGLADLEGNPAPEIHDGIKPVLVISQAPYTGNDENSNLLFSNGNNQEPGISNAFNPSKLSEEPDFDDFYKSLSRPSTDNVKTDDRPSDFDLNMFLGIDGLDEFKDLMENGFSNEKKKNEIVDLDDFSGMDDLLDNVDSMPIKLNSPTSQSSTTSSIDPSDVTLEPNINNFVNLPSNNLPKRKEDSDFNLFSIIDGVDNVTNDSLGDQKNQGSFASNNISSQEDFPDNSGVFDLPNKYEQGAKKKMPTHPDLTSHISLNPNNDDLSDDNDKKLVPTSDEPSFDDFNILPSDNTGSNGILDGDFKWNLLPGVDDMNDLHSIFDNNSNEEKQKSLHGNLPSDDDFSGLSNLFDDKNLLGNELFQSEATIQPEMQTTFTPGKSGIPPENEFNNSQSGSASNYDNNDIPEFPFLLDKTNKSDKKVYSLNDLLSQPVVEKLDLVTLPETNLAATPTFEEPVPNAKVESGHLQASQKLPSDFVKSLENGADDIPSVTKLFPNLIPSDDKYFPENNLDSPSAVTNNLLKEKEGISDFFMKIPGIDTLPFQDGGNEIHSNGNDFFLNADLFSGEKNKDNLHENVDDSFLDEAQNTYGFKSLNDEKQPNEEINDTRKPATLDDLNVAQSSLLPDNISTPSMRGDTTIPENNFLLPPKISNSLKPSRISPALMASKKLPVSSDNVSEYPETDDFKTAQRLLDLPISSTSDNFYDKPQNYLESIGTTEMDSSHPLNEEMPNNMKKGSIKAPHNRSSLRPTSNTSTLQDSPILTGTEAEGILGNYLPFPSEDDIEFPKSEGIETGLFVPSDEQFPFIMRNPTLRRKQNDSDLLKKPEIPKIENEILTGGDVSEFPKELTFPEDVLASINETQLNSQIDSIKPNLASTSTNTTDEDIFRKDIFDTQSLLEQIAENTNPDQDMSHENEQWDSLLERLPSLDIDNVYSNSENNPSFKLENIPENEDSTTANFPVPETFKMKSSKYPKKQNLINDLTLPQNLSESNQMYDQLEKNPQELQIDISKPNPEDQLGELIENMRVGKPIDKQLVSQMRQKPDNLIEVENESNFYPGMNLLLNDINSSLLSQPMSPEVNTPNLTANSDFPMKEPTGSENVLPIIQKPKIDRASKRFPEIKTSAQTPVNELGIINSSTMNEHSQYNPTENIKELAQPTLSIDEDLGNVPVSDRMKELQPVTFSEAELVNEESPNLPDIISSDSEIKNPTNLSQSKTQWPMIEKMSKKSLLKKPDIINTPESSSNYLLENETEPLPSLSQDLYDTTNLIPHKGLLPNTSQSPSKPENLDQILLPEYEEELELKKKLETSNIGDHMNIKVPEEIQYLTNDIFGNLDDENMNFENLASDSVYSSPTNTEIGYLPFQEDVTNDKSVLSEDSPNYFSLPPTRKSNSKYPMKQMHITLGDSALPESLDEDIMTSLVPQVVADSNPLEMNTELNSDISKMEGSGNIVGNDIGESLDSIGLEDILQLVPPNQSELLATENMADSAKTDQIPEIPNDIRFSIDNETGEISSIVVPAQNINLNKTPILHNQNLLDNNVFGKSPIQQDSTLPVELFDSENVIGIPHSELGLEKEQKFSEANDTPPELPMSLMDILKLNDLNASPEFNISEDSINPPMLPGTIKTTTPTISQTLNNKLANQPEAALQTQFTEQNSFESLVSLMDLLNPNKSDVPQLNFGNELDNDSDYMLPNIPDNKSSMSNRISIPEQPFKEQSDISPEPPISLMDILKLNNLDAPLESKSNNEWVNKYEATDIPSNEPIPLPIVNSNLPTNNQQKPNKIIKPLLPTSRLFNSQQPPSTGSSNNLLKVQNDGTNTPSTATQPKVNAPNANLGTIISNVEPVPPPASSKPPTGPSTQSQAMKKPIAPRPVQMPIQSNSIGPQTSLRNDSNIKSPQKKPEPNNIQQKIDELMSSFPGDPQSNLSSDPYNMNEPSIFGLGQPIKPKSTTKPTNNNTKPIINSSSPFSNSQSTKPIQQQTQMNSKPQTQSANSKPPTKPSPAASNSKPTPVSNIPIKSQDFNFDDPFSIFALKENIPATPSVPSSQVDKTPKFNFDGFGDLDILAGDDKFTEQELMLAVKNPKIRPDILLSAQNTGNTNPPKAEKLPKPSFAMKKI